MIPWERLPAPAAGLLLIAVNAVVVANAEPYSADLIEPAALILVGACLFVAGVRKALAEPDLPENERQAIIERKMNAHNAAPDYSRYTEAGLRQILTRIDGERYPERVAEITERLARFEQ